MKSSTVRQKSIDLQNAIKINNLGYKKVFYIENQLRYLILTELQKFDENWWSVFKERGFSQIVENLKEEEEYNYILKYEIEKKIRNEKIYDGSSFLLIHEIYYTNFSDLYLIIEKFWENVFRDILGGDTKRDFFVKFKNIVIIRNKLMHSRPISEIELSELEQFNFMLDSKFIDINLIKNSMIECYSISDILKGFLVELKVHQVFITNINYAETFTIEFYKKNNLKWWWNSKLFLYSKQLIDYYQKIEKLNYNISKIGLKPQIDELYIDNLIIDLNIQKINEILIKKLDKDI